MSVDIYKRFFTSKSLLVKGIAKAQSEGVERAAGFAKRATKEEVFRKASNNGVLKAPLRQLLMDACSSRKRAARDVLVELLGYRKVESRFLVT